MDALYVVRVYVKSGNGGRFWMEVLATARLWKKRTKAEKKKAKEQKNGLNNRDDKWWASEIKYDNPLLQKEI